MRAPPLSTFIVHIPLVLAASLAYAQAGEIVPDPPRVRGNRRRAIRKKMTEASMADLPQIYLTQNDMDRLLRLVEAQPGKRFEKLENELVRANVVPCEKIPEDVVTMNSRVIFENETTRERREITLVYPESADIDKGRISVLVPIGTALLGLRVGQSIDWELPGGAKQRYRIVGVPFQPEAAGEPG